MIQAYNIQDFCRAYGISRSLFYTLVKKGEGPKVVKAGRRTLIPYQAAQEWLTAKPQAILKDIR